MLRPYPEIYLATWHHHHQKSPTSNPLEISSLCISHHFSPKKKFLAASSHLPTSNLQPPPKITHLKSSRNIIPMHFPSLLSKKKSFLAASSHLPTSNLH